jgi:hypothetical protein
MPARKYPKLNRRHFGVLAWLLEHPTSTLTEGAKVLGYSRPWLSRIVNSPAFQAEYTRSRRLRMDEIASNVLGLLKKL